MNILDNRKTYLIGLLGILITIAFLFGLIDQETWMSVLLGVVVPGQAMALRHGVDKTNLRSRKARS